MSFVLRTERLRLRDYEESDQALLRALFLDARLRQYHLRNQSNEHFVAQHCWYATIQRNAQPRLAFDLTIELASQNEAIGCCSLQIAEEKAATATLGWHVLPKHWKRGYATEAAHALVAFGFTELPCNQFEAYAFADNAASIRVMRKIGLQPAHNNSITNWWRSLQRGESRPVVCYQLAKKQWLDALAQPAAIQPFSFQQAA